MDAYLSKAYDELLKSDGLCVMARGLGLKRLLVKFIQHYSVGVTARGGTKQLVFVINAKDDDEVIRDMLMADGLAPTAAPHVFTSETSIPERCEMYKRGGVFVVTSRILIQDLLLETVNLKQIAGMLVANAHRISADSIEAFILKVYRQNNSTGFIKVTAAHSIPVTKLALTR